MHLYNKKKNRIPGDRPHGVNIPGSTRRLIKVVSGDTLTFTANIVCPATREPVKAEDLKQVSAYIAVAENRFSPVIWAGSTDDKWIVLDKYRAGMVHVTIPRTVMGVLRRGSYSFSLVVDDGLVRETQMTGNFQIEYEPTGSINDIPYRSDMVKGVPITLTPEIDAIAQDKYRITYDQLLDAINALSRAVAGSGAVADVLFGEADHDPTEEQVEEAAHRIAKFVIWNDDLRAHIPAVMPDRYEPSFIELQDRVCAIIRKTGLKWSPAVRTLGAD